MSFNFDFIFSLNLNETIEIEFNVQHPELLRVNPDRTVVTPNSVNQTITVFGLSPGHVEITARAHPNENVE